MATGIRGTKAVSAGEWAMDFAAVEVAGGRCGERGTAKFTPNARARDTASLRIIQIVKTTTGGLTAPDYRWTGDEARRNQAMTTAGSSPGVEGGYFVDRLHKNLTPRTGASQAAVSPHYIDDYGAGSSGGHNLDGSKQGTTIRPASIWDFPADSADGSFLFETVAKGSDNGVVYGTVKWQFTIERSKLKNENWTVQDSASATFGAAIDKFNEVYRNPGASTAPSAATGGTP